ncbi:MAG: hypothetical protein ACFFDW_11875 [Candidatus Thorarchaeota archaeon]
MKPISLCLTHMGKTGLELVSSFPDVLPQQILNEIVLKSMPMSAKAGDYSSSTAENVVFESYIFTVPGEERNNIASLVAVFDNTKYNRDSIRKFFSFTVKELQKHNTADTKTFETILPNMFDGLTKGHVKIKISSVVTIDFDFSYNENADKKREDQFVDAMKDDLWK